MCVDEDNKKLLSKYNIELKKELKATSVIRLKDATEDSKMSRVLYNKLLSAIKFSSAYRLANKVKSSKPKLPKVYIGIEFEFIGSRDFNDRDAFNNAMIQLVGDNYWFRGEYSHNKGNYWILGKDGSLRFEDANERIASPFGYELSTPKLELFNEQHMQLLAQVIELIKTHLHGEVNKSCGTHIHIGLVRSDLKKPDILHTLNMYAKMENTIFDPIVPTSRRRNRYCKNTLATEDSIRYKYQKVSTRYCEFDYHNGHNGLCSNVHFEFRQLEGTLDLRTVQYWAILQTYILCDLLNHVTNEVYNATLSHMNAFDILFYYDFDSDLINFFIDRAIKFKSKSMQLADAQLL